MKVARLILISAGAGNRIYLLSNRGLDNGPYPVVANGRPSIRDLESLWCYDIRGK